MSLRREFPLATGMAFITLIALICGLVINGLLQLQTLGAEIRTVVEYHNRKIDLITQTQVASQLRKNSLYRMALASDAFERDARFLDFNHAGFQVGSGRAALLKMGLTPAEKRYFHQQTRLVNDIESVQNTITDLLAANRDMDAHRVLVTQAIPLQEAFSLQLTEMRNRYQKNNLLAQQHAQQTYRHTLFLTLALGVSAIFLALLIAWLTLRKIQLKSILIHDQMVELERSREALQQEATHDSLTGLANRRLFYDRLQQAIRHAHRYGSKVGILYVDLDHFKSINDTHGHHVGDAVLTEVAKRLTVSIRDSDTVARLGGDEFGVILEAIQGREDMLSASHKIDQALNAETDFYGLDLEIMASIGHALYPNDGENEDELIRMADAAMYRVKSGIASERQAHLPFNEV